MKPIYRVLTWLCALFLLAMPFAVQAKLLVRITISGPGLPGKVEVTDQEVLYALVDLPAGERLQEAPSELGRAYYTIRQDVGDGDRVFAVNVYHYYPDPQGGPEHLLFADVINGSASLEGDWFLVDERTGQALQAFLAAHVTTGPDTAHGLAASGLAWGVLAVVALLVGLGYLQARRPRESLAAAD